MTERLVRPSKRHPRNVRADAIMANMKSLLFVKGWPEPSKQIIQKVLFGFIFRLFRYQNKSYRIILPGAFRDLHEDFAEVPEDIRSLSERRLWFPTSDRLQTWLILSRWTRSMTSQPWSDPTCLRATAFCPLSDCFRLKQRDKGEVSPIRGSTRASCVRPWLTRDIV